MSNHMDAASNFLLAVAGAAVIALVLGLCVGWYLNASGTSKFIAECRAQARDAVLVDGEWKCIPEGSL
jgi:hypothetical protein